MALLKVVETSVHILEQTAVLRLLSIGGRVAYSQLIMV